MATTESINARLSATLAPYEAQLRTAEQEYNTQAEKLKTESDRALQEAYIQSRMARKALPQQLAAMGLQGGPTETSLVRLQNNYANARNDIQQGYLDNLASLDLSYYEKQQDINAQIAAAKAQAEAEIAELKAQQLAASQYGGYSSGGGKTYTIATPIYNPATGQIEYYESTGSAQDLGQINSASGGSFYMKGNNGYAFENANRQNALAEEQAKYGSQYGNGFTWGKNNRVGR